jgi:cell division septal protein FtsQ
MTRLPVRPSGGARRRPSQRRASSRLSPRRAVAALVMVVAGAATWGVAASPAFGIRTTDVSGMVVTSPAEVDAVLALGSPAPNAFMLATDGLRSSLESIPSIAQADVRVVLPGTLRVRVVERVPILAWRTGSALLLVDRDGMVIADAGAADATAAARAVAVRPPDRRGPARGELPAGRRGGRGAAPRRCRRPAEPDRDGRRDAPAVAPAGRRRLVRPGAPGEPR